MTNNTARARRQRKRERLQQEKARKIDVKKVVGAIVFCCLIAYGIYKTIFRTQILIRKGICMTAFLTEETERVRYHKPTLVYKFQIGNKTYMGNSNIEDLSKAGQNICIVYYPKYPSINWPLYRFEGKKKCNCN